MASCRISLLKQQVKECSVAQLKSVGRSRVCWQCDSHPWSCALCGREGIHPPSITAILDICELVCEEEGRFPLPCNSAWAAAGKVGFMYLGKSTYASMEASPFWVGSWLEGGICHRTKLGGGGILKIFFFFTWLRVILRTHTLAIAPGDRNSHDWMGIKLRFRIKYYLGKFWTVMYTPD